MMEKVKVLYLITRLDFGGAREIALSMASGLDKNRFAVTFISGPQDLCPEMVNKWDVDVTVIPDLIRQINPIKDLKALARLYFFIRKNKFDIVHTHTTKAGILGRIAAKLSGVPIIFHTPHGSLFHPVFLGSRTMFLLSKIENFIAMFTDKIITCSQDEKENFLRHKVATDGKYITMRWGIREDSFFKIYNSSLKRKELGVAGDDILIGNIARLVPHKGHLFCLEAFKIIVNRFPKTKLLVVGDGILKSTIQARIKELNLNDNVIMAGYRNDIAEILACLDILLFTSVYDGTPIAIIEAMLMSKSIIATNAGGGIPELIKNGITGILIPPYDKQALAQAVATLINNKNLAKKIGEEACRYAKEKFTLESMIENTNRLYDSFIELKLKKKGRAW